LRLVNKVDKYSDGGSDGRPAQVIVFQIPRVADSR